MPLFNDLLTRKGNDLSGVHQVFRVDGALQARHQVDRLSQLLAQGSHLAETDTVLAGAGALHGKRAVYDSFVELLRLFKISFALGPDKDFAVEVSVADMAKKRYRHR